MSRLSQDLTFAGGTVEDRYTGVRILWTKVIARALYDYVVYRDNIDQVKRGWSENAATWLFEPSILFNSLETICRHLQIDVEKVRIKARGMTADDAVKLDHVDRTNLHEEDIEEVARLAQIKKASREIPAFRHTYFNQITPVTASLVQGQ